MIIIAIINIITVIIVVNISCSNCRGVIGSHALGLLLSNIAFVPYCR